MFTPDLGLSIPGTIRWKKNLLRTSNTKFTDFNEKKIRRLISTHDASRFISTSMTPGFHTPKISRNEDFREISTQLVSLKKKHDLNKDKNFLYQKLLDKDRKEIQFFQASENKNSDMTKVLYERVEELENSLKEVKIKQEENLVATKVYKHMLRRMKITKIKFDEQNLALNEYLKLSEQALTEVEYRSRKLKENNTQYKTGVEVLKKFIFHETKEKQEKLSTIKNDAEQQKKNTKNREFRAKRQIEIAEAAADDERNMTAMQIREGLMVHKIFFVLLDIKLLESKKRFAVIDNAFRKIKTFYGTIDPLEMIEKILTKEQSYNQVLNSINEDKWKIEEQNRKNEDFEKKIRKIENLRIKNADPNFNLKNEVNRKNKEYLADKEKLEKVRISHEKVLAWVKRNIVILGGKPEDNNLADFFITIKEIIRHLLKKNQSNSIFDSKNMMDSMKIEDVLKIYAGDDSRKRTFLTLASYEDNLYE